MNPLLPGFWKRNISLHSQLSSAMQIALSSIGSTGSCMPLHSTKIADCVSGRQQETSRVRCPEISCESMTRRKQETCSMNLLSNSFVFLKRSTVDLKMGNKREKRRDVARGGVSLFQVRFRMITGRLPKRFRFVSGCLPEHFGSVSGYAWYSPCDGDISLQCAEQETILQLLKKTRFRSGQEKEVQMNHIISARLMSHEQLQHWQRLTLPSVAEHGQQQTEALRLNHQAFQRRQLSLFEEKGGVHHGTSA